MPHDEMQEIDQETPSDSPVPQGQEYYEFTVCIKSDGIEVDGELVPDLPTALKHVIAIVREHPASGNAQDELKAGYDSA